MPAPFDVGNLLRSAIDASHTVTEERRPSVIEGHLSISKSSQRVGTAHAQFPTPCAGRKTCLKSKGEAI